MTKKRLAKLNRRLKKNGRRLGRPRSRELREVKIDTEPTTSVWRMKTAAEKRAARRRRRRNRIARESRRVNRR